MTISEILSSFDEKFVIGDEDGEGFSSNAEVIDVKTFLKDSIIEVLDGIPFENMLKKNENKSDEYALGYDKAVEELREYIEEVKL